MIMTYINKRYRLSAQSRNAEELVKELTLAIRMIAQDVAVKKEVDVKEVLQEVVFDIEDAYGMPLGSPSD